MHQFWGRKDNSQSHRFTRDDDQLLALNYENLCDADYLNRLFYSESTSDSNEQSSSKQTSSRSQEPIDLYLTHGEICEDVLVFGDNQDFGYQCLRKRNIRDLGNLVYLSSDTFSAIIQKQVQLFEHLTTVILDRSEETPTSTTRAQIQNIEQKEVALDLSKMSLAQRLTHRSLMTCFDNLETQGPAKLTIEMVDSMTLLFCKISDTDTKGSAGNLSLYIHHLRAILHKGLAYAMQQTNDVSTISEASLCRNIKLAYACIYSLLLAGFLAKSPVDVLASVSQLVMLIIRIRELEDDLIQLVQSQSAALQETIVDQINPMLRLKSSPHENPLHMNNNNQSPVNASRLSRVPSSHSNIASKATEAEDIQPTTAKTSVPAIESAKTSSKAKEKTIIISHTTNVKHDKESSKIKHRGKDEKLNKNPDTFLNLIENESAPAPTTISVMSMFNHSPPSSPRRKSSARVKPNVSTISTTSKLDPLQTISSAPTRCDFSAHGAVDASSSDIVLASLRSLQSVPSNIFSIMHDCGVFHPKSNSQSHSIDIPSPVASESDSIAASKLKTYVWSCGQNTYGELGHGDVVFRKSFAKISSMDSKQVVSVGAGNEHTVFLSKQGKLYVCGYNDNGQCGVGSTQQVKVPSLVQGVLDSEDIVQVHAYNGCEHTLAITRDGKLYAFGYNYRGQVSSFPYKTFD
jgi:hypothetical protein